MSRELRAYPQPWSGNVAFYLVEGDPERGGKRFVGTNVTMEELPEGHMAPRETFTLSEAEAQALAEQLWHAGFRPKAATSPDGALAMQGKHLADMRVIAFAKLELEAPTK